ncbi:hypothetical protein K3495_g7109 [Podosphaera aphanis]|nr:hypothetical protein K3495_g7109 [Podosphaera aphanis]
MERLNTTRLIHNKPVQATEEQQIIEFFDEQDFMGWLNKQKKNIEWKYHNQIRSSTQSNPPGSLPSSAKKLGRQPTFEWTKDISFSLQRKT